MALAQLETKNVHDDKQQSCSLHVLQKFVTHSEIGVRPLNQPGQIGDRDLPVVVVLYRSNLRSNCGDWKVKIIKILEELKLEFNEILQG